MDKTIYFTRVRFQIVAKYKLSVFQYCVLDCIFNFSPPYSWCSLPKGKIAEYLCCSYPSIITSFSILREKGLIIQSGHKFKVSALIHDALESEIIDEIYATVCPFIRKELKITFNEYCLVDCIYVMNRKKSFFASKLYLSKLLRVSERAIFKMLKRVNEKRIIEASKKTKGKVYYVVADNFKHLFSHGKSQRKNT